MAVQQVRAHTPGAVTSGTSVSATVAEADVAVGNVLVAWIASRHNSTEVPSTLTKPANETASWARVAGDSSRIDTSGQMWVIRTTVAWPVGTKVGATFGTSDRRAILLAEYSGVDTVVRGTATWAVESDSTVSASCGSEVRAGDLVLGGGRLGAHDFWDSLTASTTLTKVSSSALRVDFNDTGGLDIALYAEIVSSGGARTLNLEARNNGNPTSNRTVGAAIVGLRSTNVAPNAPTLTKPASGAVVNRGATIRFEWQFSDPNAVDVQSAFSLRYRLVGAATWTTIQRDVHFTIYDLPAGTLAAGDYEWQVSTADALGVWGPYSSSGFFTAGDPPPGPTLTEPVNGATVDQNETATWSTPAQDSYQLRRVADNAGAPDETTVYYDSGEVVAADVRSAALTFETNSRAEHVQLRVKDGGLWSAWSSVAVNVSYTPPPTPTVTLSPDASTGSLLVMIDNPASGAEQPATAYNEVHITEDGVEQRRATGVAANGSWRYWVPISGVDYAHALRVVAVGSNGITASSTPV